MQASFGEERTQMEAIRSFKKLSMSEKAEKIMDVKKSFMYKKKPSIQIIFNTANTMLGSAILVMPISFQQTGLITSFIACVFVAVISFITANLIVKHYKHGEADLPEQIERIMGKKWKNFFAASSAFLLGIATIAYFLLMSNLLYTALETAIPGLPPKDAGITFSQFSYQWVGVILAVISFAGFNIKAMSLILKVNGYGIYAVGVYILFIIYTGFDAIFSGKIQFGSGNIRLFAEDLSSLITLLGIFALAFISHNIVIPIIKYNANFNNNTRDVGYAYIITSLIYMVIGIFGVFGSNWREACGPTKQVNTVMDCFKDSTGFTFVFSLIAQGLVLIQLTNVLPVLNFITRSQLFGIFYNEVEEIPAWKFFTWNCVIIALCLLFEIFGVKPSLLISLCGAVCGYLLVYLVPIAMHFKASNKVVHDENQELLIDESEGISSSVNIHKDMTSTYQESTKTNQEDTRVPVTKSSITLAGKILYGFLMLYGFGIMISELVNIF